LTVDKFTQLTPELHGYLVEHSSHRDALARKVEAAAEETPVPLMQIAGDQAALITILVRAIGARRALEVGTFLGYGAIAIARGLPEDGHLICLEIDEDYASRAAAHLQEAVLADRVEIRVGPALDSLHEIDDDGGFDFCFIDADKAGYPDYYEEALRLLRPGGLVMLDNTLLGGRVLDPPSDDDSAQVMAELNRRIAADERVEATMLGIADGITLALRR
jgi:caffeoyl-CoA O-methyltransferase